MAAGSTPSGLKATIMFSGGSDSTLAAALMLKQCDHVTLFTCQPGFLLFVENSKVNAQTLIERFGPERVTHRIVDIRPLMNRIPFAEWRRDLCDYGVNLTALFCLGCRLAMHAAAIIYGLENGIPLIADGSIEDQSTSPEQLRSVLRRNAVFYERRYGIRYVSPIYDESESDRLAYELGVTKVRGLKKQFILFDTQPTCPWGVPADVYGRLFYGWPMGSQRERDAARYLASKHRWMESAIADYFAGKGLDLEELVAKNKERIRHSQIAPAVPQAKALGNESEEDEKFSAFLPPRQSPTRHKEDISIAYRTATAAKRQPNTSTLAHYVRFIMRYVLASYLVPASGMIGLCGLVRHYGLALARRIYRNEP